MCARVYTHLVCVAGEVRDERLKAQRTNFNIINITYFDEAFIAFALIPDVCGRRQNAFDIRWQGETGPGSSMRREICLRSRRQCMGRGANGIRPAEINDFPFQHVNVGACSLPWLWLQVCLGLYQCRLPFEPPIGC